MIRKFLAGLLCLALTSCGGFNPAYAQAVFGSAPLAAPPTYTSAQGSPANAIGTVAVSPGSQPAGCVFMGSAPCPTFVAPAVFSYTHISTSTTTIIMASGAGHTLHMVCVNKAGTAGSVTVDDAATATTPTIAVMDSTVALCHDYDVILTVGLTIVTTGAPDVTVSWR